MNRVRFPNEFKYFDNNGHATDEEIDVKIEEMITQMEKDSNLSVLTSMIKDTEIIIMKSVDSKDGNEILKVSVSKDKYEATYNIEEVSEKFDLDLKYGCKDCQK